MPNIREQLKQYRRALPWITLKELLLIILSTIPYALTVNQLLVPHAIVGGGVTGLCEIIYFATNTYVPIWLSSLLINVLLLVIATVTVGWRYALRTIWGVLWLTVWLKVIPIATVPLLTDSFMAVVIGGLFTGCFLGICFLNNGSTGGTDIIAAIINKYRDVSLGHVIMFCDIFIISSSYLVLRDFERVIYGYVVLYVTAFCIDWVVNTMRSSVQFFIISEKYKEIGHRINREPHRGCTVIDAQGFYSGRDVKMLFVLAKRRQSDLIFRIINDVDPNAFVSQSAVIGVYGEGFDRFKVRRTRAPKEAPEDPLVPENP